MTSRSRLGFLKNNQKGIESMEWVDKKKDNYIIVKDEENDYDVISKVITVYYKDKQGKRKHLKLDQIIERVS